MNPPSPPPNPKNEPEKNFDEIILDIKSDDQATPEKEIKKKSFKGLFGWYNYINEWVIEQSPIKLQEKLLFFQLLAAIIHAGISVPEALRMLEKQTKNEKLQHAIRDIRLLIEDGESFSNAMRRTGDIFNEATCSIIGAGEKSGKLNEVLKELVSQYNRLNNIQKKVKSVMTYPIIVFVVMILLSVVIVIFVVPKLIDLFGEVGNLPLPTRILIGASDLVRNQWPFLLLGLAAAVTLFIVWKRSRTGRRQWSIILINTPIISGLLKGMILSRVTRIFGFLISSGVPIIEGLKITASISSNPLYEERLLLAADDLSKGISIAENLSDHEKLFPSMLINMISVGEKTASLEGVMLKIADFYEEELERKIDNLSKLMEPIILALIAAGAIFMILAIYLPILRLNDQILGGGA
ncbi:type II secretion system F family protein [Candidatus Gracilibacteria bacterium]|nr:type II secretion system F family protein [Candidatus Gracilibacteria bacterium]MCF7819750.1 type II secretion system F family protein [Candidatus Gracilibacteria bacterium]